MPRDVTEGGLDFGALRRCIERRDADALIEFYAPDARVTILDARAPQTSRPFELRGRAEIARHLRAVYGQQASHSVGEELNIGGDLVTFRETCEYPDGSGVVVETTLDVRDGRITRQSDLVAEVARTDTARPGRLPIPGQETGKEDLL